LPEKFNTKTTNSLGLQLVQLLADQIGGQMEIKVQNGTCFTIRFSSK